ncbi:hypothetical protein [Nocardia sp. NBC_00416]|uniref:hypothetical protein n=1 Tax=Nocardia sp. NBC_00416 TaxID=2975991 RepID=UPI002E1B14D7
MPRQFRSRLVPVADGFCTGHQRDRASGCPWSGAQIVEKGIHPPLFTREPPGSW